MAIGTGRLLDKSFTSHMKVNRVLTLRDSETVLKLNQESLNGTCIFLNEIDAISLDKIYYDS